MKYRLFDFIQCPDCKGQLELQVFKDTKAPCDSNILNDNNLCPSDCRNPDPKIIKTDKTKSHCKKCYGTEILEGLLICKCRKAYPVVKGVPRFLSDAFEGHPEFTREYYIYIEKYEKNISFEEKKLFKKKFKDTQQTFGYQWKTWGKSERIYGFTDDEAKEWFLTTLTSRKIDISYFRGKTVLEVGCGHGRFVKILNEFDCENIGLDLSPSIDLVYEIIKDKPTAHVIQANLMNSPLKEESFDYVWSHGVLHHTPSTKEAFNIVSKLPKKHVGWLYIWVYPKGGFIWEYGFKFIRSITTALPPKLLYYISYALVPFLYIVPAYNERVNLSNMSWSECALSVNDWLAPKYQWHHTKEEVVSWFEECGYKDIEILPANGVGVTGIRK